MEENTNVDVNVDTNKVDNENVKDLISMSKTDYDKAIQSETDKVRTDYVKKMKALEDKIKELTPVTKSQAELDMEKRLADLESKAIEVDRKEKALKLQDALSAKDIDKSLAKFLKEDIDIEEFGNIFGNVKTSLLKKNSYQPQNHNTFENLTKEQFKKMPYTEQAELYEANPTLWQKLNSK